MEAGNALMKAVIRQQHWEAHKCAYGMVEASNALMKVV